MFDFVFVYFFSFGFILFYFFFNLFTFYETSSTLCNSIQKCIKWFAHSLSLVNFLDMINIMYFLSRVLGFHPKFACCGVPPKICICVYTDTIRFFLYGYHPFLLIRIPSVSFYTDTIRFFVITGFHPFLNRFNSLLLVI